MRGKIEIEVNLSCCWISHQHLFAVEGISAYAIEASAIEELIGRHVITVRPGANLEIVRKVGTGGGDSNGWSLEVINIIGAGRIAGLGNGYT